MGHRAVIVNWSPRSRDEWDTLTLIRSETARLWNDLVERHYRIRRRGTLRWPNEYRWYRWAKGKYTKLHSQSVLATINEFCMAVRSARELRRNGDDKAKYPWRKVEYRSVIYFNQAVYPLGSHGISLSNGKISSRLKIELPRSLVLPGRIMEVRIYLDRIIITCKIDDVIHPECPTIGVDLGVNTLIAATDGEKAILISGREAKATVQWRNKNLARAESKLSHLHRGSKRWGRLQRRKRLMSRKCDNRIKDLTHKATRKVADEFPHAKVYVGKPFNDASQCMRSKSAQQVSQVSTAVVIQQLDYKTLGATRVEEYYTSQTCPVCGERNQCSRIYKCKNCGLIKPRDVIGSVNILCIGTQGSLMTGCSVPNTIRWTYPTQVSRRHPSSSGGHPASSLAVSS
jgi:putative transposase